MGSDGFEIHLGDSDTILGVDTTASSRTAASCWKTERATGRFAAECRTCRDVYRVNCDHARPRRWRSAVRTKHRRAWIGSEPENGPRISSSCNVWNTVRDTPEAVPTRSRLRAGCLVGRQRGPSMSVCTAQQRVCGALMEIMLDMLDMRDEQGRSKHSKPNS